MRGSHILPMALMRRVSTASPNTPIEDGLDCYTLLVKDRVHRTAEIVILQQAPSHSSYT
jgi:hypothetical protein